MLSNCYKVFREDRLYAIVPTEYIADSIITGYKAMYEVAYNWRIEPAFIDGLGF